MCFIKVSGRKSVPCSCL